MTGSHDGALDKGSRQVRQPLAAEIIAEIRASRDARERMDEAVQLALDLSRSEFRCLNVLLETGALSGIELSNATGLTTASITGVVDRLERKGYARRVPDPSDRRRVFIYPTQRIEALATEIWGPIAEETGRDLARYSREELAVLRDFLRGRRDLIETSVARVGKLSFSAPTLAQPLGPTDAGTTETSDVPKSPNRPG